MIYRWCDVYPKRKNYVLVHLIVVSCSLNTTLVTWPEIHGQPSLFNSVSVSLHALLQPLYVEHIELLTQYLVIILQNLLHILAAIEVPARKDFHPLIHRQKDN